LIATFVKRNVLEKIFRVGQDTDRARRHRQLHEDPLPFAVACETARAWPRRRRALLGSTSV
jgi:hypothetical protein